MSIYNKAKLLAERNKMKKTLADYLGELRLQ